MNRNMFRLFPVIAIIALIVTNCGNRGPAEIHYGQDSCDYCKMTIADGGFGSEMVTTKGKVYKFDSIECLAAFSIAGGIDAGNIHSMWVTDFNLPKTFLAAEKAAIIASERQKSPMGVGLVAVKTPELAARLIEVVGGKILDWEQVRSLVATDWKLQSK